MGAIVRRRKMFSGVGRPRKDAPRKPCGRLIQPPKQETVLQAKATVLSQPHRNGSTDQRRWWAIGRLILDGKIRSDIYQADELHEAASRYYGDYQRIKWVMDSRRAFAATAGGPGRDLTPEQGEAIRKDWSNICRTLAEMGPRCVSAAELGILDDPTRDEHTLAPWIILSLPHVLDALARHYGLAVRRE